MNDIKLIPTGDLLEELMLRYDHAIFSGIRCVKSSTDQGNFYQSKWTGNCATCMGLAARMEYVINKDHFDESEPGTIEDY